MRYLRTQGATDMQLKVKVSVSAPREAVGRQQKVHAVPSEVKRAKRGPRMGQRAEGRGQRMGKR